MSDPCVSTMNMHLLIKKSVMVIATLVILLSLVAPVRAQENRAAPSGNAAAVPIGSQGPTDPAELEAFLDGLMAEDMEEYHIPGAAVSVDKDGNLFFAKGYGYADLENKIPVDAEQTIFPTGSAGKLFTWTAVMQLVEQRKLDLDADVNTYLDFHIPDNYPQPITLKHLMTHTAGFEDLGFENFTWNADVLMPVGEWMSTHIPGRVRPPGEVAGYSYYGAMLAGYIVARVSVQPYEQYIQEHIFDPLRMEHSTIQMPVPPYLSAHMSLGYWDVDGAVQAVPRVPDVFMTQPATAPEGEHMSTVPDMARFMIMQLQDCFYGDASTGMRILEETTGFNMVLLFGCLLVFLSMIPVALVRAIRNHRPNGDWKSAYRGARTANWVIVAISVLNLLFAAGVANMVTGLGFPFFGVSLFDKFVLGLGVLSTLLMVGALIYAMWPRRRAIGALHSVSITRWRQSRRSLSSGT